MWDHPCEQAPELSETLSQYSSLVVVRFLTTTPNLPSQSTSIPRRTRTTQLRETWRTQGQEPTLPLSLDLTRPLVNHWSPLSHASHCTTSTRPAAATQMRARINPATQPKVFTRQMPFLPQPFLFPSLGIGSAQRILTQPFTTTGHCSSIWTTLATC